MGKRIFVALWTIWALCVCVTANASNATTIDRIKTAIETRLDNERFIQLQAMKLEKLNRLKAEEQQAPEPEMTYLGRYKITGYVPWCKHCCGKEDGITTSGVEAIVGTTIAMKGLEFGTRVSIDGLGEYIVQDRGVGAGVIDVACYTHEDCYALTGNYDVYIVEG